MNIQTMLGNTLHLISHVYWKRKDQFDLAADTYTTWMLFAVESGSFRYQIDSEKGVAGQNELLFCPPGSTLYRELITPMSLHFIAFTLGNNGTEEAAVPFYKVHPVDSVRLSQNFSYLRNIDYRADTYSKLQKQWIINDMWYLSCNEWHASVRHHELVHLSKTGDKLMDRAAEWLQLHAYTKFSMKELSGLIGLSPVQFTRRFQHAFRMLPSEYVRHLRIRKAARLLLETDLTLDQIAETCGYDNGFYLSRVFTQSMSISPSKYRNQNRL